MRIIRRLNFLFLILLYPSYVFPQSNLNGINTICSIESLRIHTNEKQYKDTAILLRNCELAGRKVVCNDFSNSDIEKLIWGSKYISVYLASQEKLNKISIISYKRENQNGFIASYFLCDKKTKETIEMVRFKIVNNAIVGINCLPNIAKGFISIEEYDNQLNTNID